jgi:hypothetical protein
MVFVFSKVVSFFSEMIKYDECRAMRPQVCGLFRFVNTSTNVRQLSRLVYVGNGHHHSWQDDC